MATRKPAKKAARTLIQRAKDAVSGVGRRAIKSANKTHGGGARGRAIDRYVDEATGAQPRRKQ